MLQRAVPPETRRIDPDAGGRFTAEQCETFFAQVLINDAVDAQTWLPATIDLTYEPVMLTDCYGIARQVWEGIDRRRLRALIRRLARNGTLDADERLIFKHDRAKFKQLRFAFATCDRTHQYPRWLHFVTSTMGHLQDDFRNGRATATRLRAALLSILLGRASFGVMRRELDGFAPSASADFADYVGRQMRRVQHDVSRADVTGKAFHDIRKIISRQSAFYLAANTLDPTPTHHAVFRFLSAINGLMGQLHDGLIERRLAGVQDYHADRFPLPEEIRGRLAVIAERFAAAASGNTA